MWPSRLPAEYELDLDDWIDNYMDIQPGHHLSLIGPNGTGKTTTGFQILNKLHEIHPQTNGLALVMKRDKGPKGAPRGTTGDMTVTRLARRYKAPITRDWPLRAGQKVMHPAKDVPFWVLWPRHSQDFRLDGPKHKAIHEKALVDGTNIGRRYTFADEVLGLVARLRLADILEYIWSQGRSSEHALIAATQRPAAVPRFMYSSARHLILYRDNDAEARKRYGEISGMDPKRLLALTDGLRAYRMRPRPGGDPRGDLVGEALYVHPETDTLAVLRPTGGRPA